VINWRILSVTMWMFIIGVVYIWVLS